MTLSGGEAQDDPIASVREIAQQIPVLGSLRSGALIAISDRAGEGAKRGGLFRRVLGKAPSTHVPRACRCTALIARGYVRLGGGVDDKGIDWAWGYAP